MCKKPMKDKNSEIQIKDCMTSWKSESFILILGLLLGCVGNYFFPCPIVTLEAYVKIFVCLVFLALVPLMFFKPYENRFNKTTIRGLNLMHILSSICFITIFIHCILVIDYNKESKSYGLLKNCSDVNTN